MKNKLKKFFKDHETQVYHFVATVATATGVGFLVGRKVINDNKPVQTWGVTDKETGAYKGCIVVLKNGNEVPFFKEIPPPKK